jgi:hypothetical protein
MRNIVFGALNIYGTYFDTVIQALSLEHRERNRAMIFYMTGVNALAKRENGAW